MAYRRSVLFDHRLDEMVEILRKQHELTAGYVYASVLERNFTVGAKEDVLILDIYGECGLMHTLASITLPSGVSPEVCFIAYHDNYLTEDMTVKEYYEDMSLTAPSPVGWVTQYGPTTYSWVVPWRLRAQEKITVGLRNKTSSTCTVNLCIVEGFRRPYMRHVPLLRKRG